MKSSKAIYRRSLRLSAEFLQHTNDMMQEYFDMRHTRNYEECRREFLWYRKLKKKATRNLLWSVKSYLKQYSKG